MNTLELTPRDNYLIIRLNRGRANPMSQQMMTEIREVIADVKDNPDIVGAILTGSEGMFSAGLDIKELYGLERPDFREFLLTFRGMVKELASFPKPLIAAITGHSPAGGCILGICSDYRVMAEGKFRIGLNEVPVGLFAPRYVTALYAMWVGKRQAYHALLEGKLFLPEEAREIGLVDELVPTEEVLSRAEAQLKHYLALPTRAWTLTKASLRQELFTILEEDFEEALAISEALWWEQGGREVMGEIVRGLAEKRQA